MTALPKVRLSQGHSGSMRGAPPIRFVALDFLRGVAILLVIFSHSPSPLPDQPIVHKALQQLKLVGWTGVDLFFILSGFLVGGLLFKEYGRRSSINGARFLIRRGFKVWPQYYLFVIAAIAIKTIQHRPTGLVWPNLVNVQNYWLTPLRHTWSLAVEEHFYLGLTAFFLILSHFRLISVRAIAGFFFFCVLLSFGSRLYMLSHGVDRDVIAYATNCRVETLALGVLLAGLFHLRRTTFHVIAEKRALLAAIFVGAVTYVFLEPQRSTDINLAVGFWIVGIGAASALMLICFAPVGTVFQRAEEFRFYKAVAWIGINSYGIYLWHIAAGERPTVYLYRRLSERLPQDLTAIAALLFNLAICVAAGAVSTWLVESPILRVRDRVFPTFSGGPAVTPEEAAGAA